jgi:hypothetical protein
LAAALKLPDSAIAKNSCTSSQGICICVWYHAILRG